MATRAVCLTRPLNASIRSLNGRKTYIDRPRPVAVARVASVERTVDVLTAAPLENEQLLNVHNVHVLCGRLAMSGLALGTVGELAGHGALATQLAAGAPEALAGAAVVALASAAPLLAGEREGEEVFGPFNPPAELANGNLALAATVAVAAIEAVVGGPLL